LTRYKSSGRDSSPFIPQSAAEEVERNAHRFSKIVRRKEEALHKQDFDLAANMRAEECAIFKSVGLRARTGLGSTILFAKLDEQIQHLESLLRKEQPASN